MINLDDIKTLVNSTDEPIFSLYLRVDAALEQNQADTPAWRIYVKNAIKEAGQAAEANGQQDAWDTAQDQINTYFEGYSPSGKGLVMFAGPQTTTVYELPVMPIENRHAWGKIDIAPLLWLIDEYERYLVVLVDSEEAHFLTTYLGQVDREDAMASERFTFDFREKSLVPRPTGTAGDEGQQVTGGSHRDRFDDKMDDYIKRFHSDVAERIREMMKDTGAGRLVLGGLEKAAHSVEDQLHEQVVKALVGVENIPLQESDSDVMKRVLPIALDYERSREMDTVKDVINAAKAKGRGAIGHDDVAQALEMQQVETLIAPWPPEDEDRLNDITLEAFGKGAAIELVHGAAARELRNNGEGIAARLYYPTPSPE